MTGWQRLRVVINWVNLMTPLGLVVAKVGGGALQRGPAGLWIATGYQLRFPIASAFTLGNVISTQHGVEYLLAEEKAALLRHEATHSVQAAVLGPLFLPLYVMAGSYSWLVSADFGGRNLFEIWAGLESGSYEKHPLRPTLVRIARLITRR